MLIQVRIFRTLFIFASSLLFVGCEPTIQLFNKEKSPASVHTIASDKRMAESLDLTDQQDFVDAQRGLVASSPNNELRNQQGDIMWNPESYVFVSGDAPETVNPRLWRQAKLNNIRGLFRVDEGIHQLWGFDLANTTLIKSNNGWIIVDSLTSLETTAAAMEFA
jgi:alkyl sulfatase BDS1-like metallo-beta-lactamase superfamily hydrolase